MSNRTLARLRPYEEPVTVEAEEGAVVLVGPGFEMPMTPEAALLSAERLRQAAEEALKRRRPVRREERARP